VIAYGTCLFLYLIVPNWPHCTVVLNLIVSLYSVVQGDVCPGADIPVKGPRSQFNLRNNSKVKK